MEAFSAESYLAESYLEGSVGSDMVAPCTDFSAAAVAQVMYTLELQRQACERAKKNGTYGFCEDCGQKIDPERLEALPEATRCINCQTEWEKKKNRRKRQ